ncbi:Uncharacterised protein [Mycobacterium tuberculosis]|nr:Uncharacterised protein [Mycobacterium tuberculosis]COY60274.1 Uncharacterised protein [Mycobacterium tuberculosis]
MFGNPLAPLPMIGRPSNAWVGALTTVRTFCCTVCRACSGVALAVSAAA